MRKLLPVLIISLILAACGSPAAPAAPPTSSPAPEVQTVAASPTAEPAAPAADPTPEPAAETGLTGQAVFAIDPSRSQASFAVDEILRNAPFTAIGVTSQVSGEITVDFDVPAASVVGPVAVQAGSLTTDSGSRNGMIQRFILETSAFPTITFTPTSISGLPEVVEIGVAYPVTITGDLTIKSVTASETFEGTVTLLSATELQGEFTANVLRGTTYGLQIPSVPSVASVDDLVRLEISFVAVRQ